MGLGGRRDALARLVTLWKLVRSLKSHWRPYPRSALITVTLMSGAGPPLGKREVN